MKKLSLIVMVCAIGACQIKPSMTVEGSPNKHVKVSTTITPASVLPNATIMLGR